jgi:uncharacterized protein YbaA (DUF1428 family)
MRYIDGYIVPVPKRNLKAYLRLSRKMGRISMKHGALEYTECVADDLQPDAIKAFSPLAKLKAGETVFFSWTAYNSKADRDRVAKKVHEDPRIKNDVSKMPFDMRRTAFWRVQDAD